MTREERIHAVAYALVRALRPGLRECYVADEALGNQTTLHLAEIALDAADATREPRPMARPAAAAMACPLCESSVVTGLVAHSHWQTACSCTNGNSRISAGHSVRRWVANVRRRNELRAVALIAARSGQPCEAGR